MRRERFSVATLYCSFDQLNDEHTCSLHSSQDLKMPVLRPKKGRLKANKEHFRISAVPANSNSNSCSETEKRFPPAFPWGEKHSTMSHLSSRRRISFWPFHQPSQSTKRSSSAHQHLISTVSHGVIVAAQLIGLFLEQCLAIFC